MKVEIGTITIKSYQMEDFVNMLIENNYIVEVQNKDNKHYYITICKIFEEFEESEENNE